MVGVEIDYTVGCILVEIAFEEGHVYLFILQVANGKVGASHPQLPAEVERWTQVVLKVLLTLRSHEELLDSVHANGVFKLLVYKA